MRSFAIFIATAALSGCMTYDFTPVEPAAFEVGHQEGDAAGLSALPRLMLAVDKSGSMAFDINAEAPCAAPGCRTRWADLTQAMDAFLTSSGVSAHLGMVPFPVNDTCGGAGLNDIPSQGVDLDVSAEPDTAARMATAASIRTRLTGLTPGGGTPTAATLGMLEQYGPLVVPATQGLPPVGTRAVGPAYVLLLTDGLPNCNSAFATSSLDCLCTNTQALQPASTCGTPTANQCLDEAGTVGAIAALRARGIKTIVVGFGPTTVGANRTTLSAMALAGGFERPCNTDADCGTGDTCSVNTLTPCGQAMTACARRDFQASNAADLGQVLDVVRGTIVCNNPCLMQLSTRPVSEAWISVKVNGTLVPAGPDAWRWVPRTNELEFLGQMCADIRQASQGAPMALDVRVLKQL